MFASWLINAVSGYRPTVSNGMEKIRKEELVVYFKYSTRIFRLLAPSGHSCLIVSLLIISGVSQNSTQHDIPLLSVVQKILVNADSVCSALKLYLFLSMCLLLPVTKISSRRILDCLWSALSRFHSRIKKAM
jgi:hypothetical protein